MKTTAREWNALTQGEQLAILQFQVWKNERKWKNVNSNN